MVKPQNKFSRKKWSSYDAVNSIFFLLLGSVFLYLALLYMPGDSTCIIKIKTGLPCSTCGLTRDFQSILHLKFSSLINVHAIPIFCFFFIQFLTRGILIFLATGHPRLIIADSIVSGIIFLVLFTPLLIA